ncbi:MAG TPA: FHA domain-containing protein, partial [Thermoanaerobaculia bacterium]|nr:FHA domain-containing protein [Thermoanaerobaculia bacterium]
MLSFEVRKTGGESEVRKVHRDVIHIGASTGNDLVVRARGVLGRHARISVAGEELRLEVLGSAPGSDVTLNGSIVKSAALAAGDRIAIGEATITLLNGPAPNPNRIAAPPPRGHDALSLAAAALGPAVLTPSPATVPAAATTRPVASPARLATVPAEVPRRLDVRHPGDPWPGFFERLHRPVPFEELLQEIAAYIASA